jgi:excisionase family DNA binding protein
MKSDLSSHCKSTFSTQSAKVTLFAMPKKYFTPKEAADQLGVSPTAIRNWIKLGLITDVRFTPGGHRRIPRASVGLVRKQMDEQGK